MWCDAWLGGWVAGWLDGWVCRVDWLATDWLRLERSGCIRYTKPTSAPRPRTFQATDADGQLTSVGTTRSYLEKYNTTTAATPLLTAPMPAVVDLWSVEDPPADPSIILFAANVTQLRAQLQRPWSGPRVRVRVRVRVRGDGWGAPWGVAD